METAIITLKGEQTDTQNQKNVIEFVSEAKFYKKDSTYYVVYDETEITGMEGTKTTIKISKDVVSIIRFGTVSSNMTFEKGIKHSCNYGTGYGTLDVSTKANEVNTNIEDDGGKVYVDYDVEVEGKKIGKNSFSLIIKVNSASESN